MVFHALRTFAVYFIYKKLNSVLKKKYAILALLGAAAIYKFVSYLIDKFIEKLLNARRLLA